MRLWSAVESQLGFRASTGQWTRLLADEWTHVGGFFKPTGAIVSSIVDDDGRAWRVAEYDNGQTGLICPDTGESQRVARPDLAVYRFDHAACCKQVAKSLSLVGTPEAIDRSPQTWFVGHLVPAEGLRHPVYMVLGNCPREVSQKVDLLTGRADTPIVVLVSDVAKLLPDPQGLRGQGNNQVVGLVDTLRFTGTGRIELTQSGKELLAGFQRATQPIEQRSPRFPTPLGARWKDVTIRFVDGEQVHISVGDVKQRFDFRQIDMCDRRRGSPNKQWELLRELAENNGVVVIEHLSTRKKRQKHKEALDRVLEDFFRIDESPFETIHWGWSAKFRCRSDR